MMKNKFLNIILVLWITLTWIHAENLTPFSFSDIEKKVNAKYKNNIERAKLYAYMGDEFSQKKDYRLAVDLYRKSLTYFSKNSQQTILLNDKILEIYLIKAKEHCLLKEYDNATFFINKASTILKEFKDKQDFYYVKNLLALLGIKAGIYKGKYDFKSALIYYNKSLSIINNYALLNSAKEEKNILLSTVYLNIGQMYAYNKEYHNSLTYYNKALTFGILKTENKNLFYEEITQLYHKLIDKNLYILDNEEDSYMGSYINNKEIEKIKAIKSSIISQYKKGYKLFNQNKIYESYLISKKAFFLSESYINNNVKK